MRSLLANPALTELISNLAQASPPEHRPRRATPKSQAKRAGAELKCCAPDLPLPWLADRPE